MDWRILVFYPEPEARDLAPVNVTDFSIGSIYILCATFSANVNRNYRLLIKKTCYAQ
jgi:hypothetical protein